MLFDQGVLQVQQVVIAADLLPELVGLAGVRRPEQFLTPSSGHATERFAAVGPWIQADGKIVATAVGAVLTADRQVVHFGRDRPVVQVDAQAVGHDAADLGDSIHTLLLG